ncbi:MAG: ATP-binding cassette domain-containing protein [Planctomycetaceae bacterium]|nr:ATP-binding cassette domain-containing protein [Planctomycetaceae bacterium]
MPRDPNAPELHGVLLMMKVIFSKSRMTLIRNSRAVLDELQMRSRRDRITLFSLLALVKNRVCVTINPMPKKIVKKATPTKAAAKKAVRKKVTVKKKVARKKPVALFDKSRSLNPGFPQPNPLPNWAGGWLTVRGARQHNLKSIDVAIPLGTFTVVTGVSGSGKSSLVEDVLYNTLAHQLHRASLSSGAHERIEGVERINKVIRVDQQPLGQTPTSNPATYTGVFELMRNLFAQLPDAKLRGYTARRFSFNVPGGRCEKCEGNGQLKIEMHFLPDVWITCDACNGKRYDRQTLEVKFRDHSIADILEMSCGQALALFRNIPKIRRILQTICDVGLDYLSLGQAAPTLSGGEAQRVKLAAELSRPDTGRTLYLLDEPTTGLHFDDLQNLLGVVQRLVDVGNTVVMIEHNLDMIKSADWVIDLGPEAGFEGGYLVYAGTPEALVDYAKQRAALPEKKQAGVMRSYTAEELAPVLAAGPFVERIPYNPERLLADTQGNGDSDDVTPDDDDAQMPWEVNGRKWHTQTMISRTGKPCKWDGRILAEVVDRIEETGFFAETDWNSRTIVEIRAPQKSLGWFLHAITAEEWLLKLKFRTAKNTFRRDSLAQQLALAPLNDMEDIPLYGTEPRTRVNNATHGPYQEVELRVHSWHEIDRPEFWHFLETAIRGFAKFLTKVKSSPEEITPWRVLKEKWHFLPKGFVGGTTPVWSYPLLEEIFSMVKTAAPDAEPNWSNKVLVPFTLPGGKRSWVIVNTKRVDGIYLELYVKKNSITLGLISGIGHDRSVDGTRDGFDVVTFVFTKTSELKKAELAKVLQLAVENSM